MRVQFDNSTDYEVEPLLRLALGAHRPRRLLVRIDYLRRNARSPYSGAYYTGRNRIRVAINRHNRYPLRYEFYRPGSTRDPGDPQHYWRHLRSAALAGPEALILTVFLHEMRHYLDDISGQTMHRRETAADMYAYQQLHRLHRASDRPLVLNGRSRARGELARVVPQLHLPGFEPAGVSVGGPAAAVE